MVFSDKNKKPDVASLINGGKQKQDFTFGVNPAKVSPDQKAKEERLKKALNRSAKLLNDGKVFEAANVLVQAHNKYPQSPEPLFRLGMITMEQMDLMAAEKWFRACLDRAPFDADATMNLAMTKARLGKLDEAVKIGETGIELNRTPLTLTIMCNIYRINGEKEKAEAYMMEALKLDPEYLPALAVYGESKKFTDDDPAFEALKNIDNSARKLEDQEAIFLNTALGKAYFDTKSYNEGFKYYRKANEIKKRTLDLSKGMIDQVSNETDVILESFSKENLEQAWRHVAESEQSDLPIFIMGMPRSGTTLTEQIIATHPEVVSAGEVNDLVRSLYAEGAASKEFKDTVPETLRPENFSKTGGIYLNRMNAKFPGARYITDKLPMNYLWMGLISMALPNAKMVLCLRNPMDCGLSIYRQDFRSDTFWYNDLSMIGRIYKQFHRVVSHWQEVMPDKFFIMDYDKLVQNPEEEVRALIDYLGFEWSDDYLNFHKSKNTVTTASINQVRSKINTKSLDLWKNLEDELKPLYDEVSDLM